MKLLIKHKLLINSFLLITCIGILFALLTPHIYVSRSQVVIFRQKIETPELGNEESRNRWIWIRDGLNQKSAIISDKLITKILQDKMLNMYFEKLHYDNQSIFSYLNKNTKIQYTGADENNFLIETKASDPEVSLTINKLILSQLRYLNVEAFNENFEKTISIIENKKNTFSGIIETQKIYQDKIERMTLGHLIEQNQRELGFVIIKEPVLGRREHYLEFFLTVFAFAFIGIITGLAAETIISNSKVIKK